MTFFRKSLCILFSLFVVLFFTSCSSAIKNTADELTLNSWESTLENGNVLSLSFTEDNATLSIKFADGTSAEISGLCELNDTHFVVHDSSTGILYPFSYDVHFDKVEVIYNSKSVSLYKK